MDTTLWLLTDGEDEEEYADDSPCEDDEDDGVGLRLGARVDIDTSRIEEIPAKEPKFHAVPLKSALKKPPTPTQDCPNPLKWVQNLLSPHSFAKRKLSNIAAFMSKLIKLLALLISKFIKF